MSRFQNMAPVRQTEQEEQLNWPPCMPAFTGRVPPPPKYRCKPTNTEAHRKPFCYNQSANGGQDYEFEYDEGLSARLGVKRIPLLMGQRGRDGQFIFKPSPFGVDKPLRTQPKQLQPYWTPVQCPEPPKAKTHRRRHIGMFCDPNLLPPNETILKNF